jgi:hypothetical protein
MCCSQDPFLVPILTFFSIHILSSSSSSINIFVSSLYSQLRKLEYQSSSIRNLSPFSIASTSVPSYSLVVSVKNKLLTSKNVSSPFQPFRLRPPFLVLPLSLPRFFNSPYSNTSSAFNLAAFFNLPTLHHLTIIVWIPHLPMLTSTIFRTIFKSSRRQSKI